MLGDRLVEARKIRSLTQEQLASDARVSVDLVSKVETGNYGDVRLKTLRSFADVLQVTLSYLLEEGGKAVKEPDPRMLHDVRYLLTPLTHTTDVDEQELTYVKLRQRLAVCKSDYDKIRYDKVLSEISALIIAIEAAASIHEGEAKLDLYRLLAHAYILTSRTLIFVCCEDLAIQAIRQAVDAADKVGDPVLQATAMRNYSSTYIRQGLYDVAETIAVRTAESIEPPMTKAVPEHLAAWGRLLRTASAATIYNNEDRADELLRLAHSAAVRINVGKSDSEWLSLSPAMVGIQRVDNARVAGDPETVLRIGKTIRNVDGLPLVEWLWNQLMVADAQTTTGDDKGAVVTLKAIHNQGPQWLEKGSRLGHEVVKRLLGTLGVRSAKSSGLADLARKMGVEP